MKPHLLHGRKSLAVFVISIGCLFVIPVAAHATNVTVDCSGATPGAFTSLQAAIDSLDVVGPHVITFANQPCTGTARIIDHQRITIVGTGPNSTINGAGKDVITIVSSTSIQLNQINVTGGNRGVVALRHSELTLVGCALFNNAASGLRIDDSTLTVFRSQFFGNGAAGINMLRTHAVINGVGVGNFFHDNAQIGLNLENGASAQLVAPNFVQNNGAIGVQVDFGSSAEFLGGLNAQANIVEGNPLIGLNVVDGHVFLGGANKIRNNGFNGQLFHAGVRVDDGASLITGGFVGGEVEITGNTGPGIDSTTGGHVDLTVTLVNNNTGDGIRALGHAHVAFFPPNTNTVSGNAGKGVRCDESSIFFGDPKGVLVACEIFPFDSAPAPMQRHMHENDGDGD